MDYLSSTYFFDYDTDEIQNLIQEFNINSFSQKEKAIKLYLKIRDLIKYNPYHISLTKDHYRASVIAKKPEGHCIEKSILLIACLRGLQIPSRIHFAKVKNHIGPERLIERFGTNEMTPHGMVDLLLEGKWLKVSPAFNIELCVKCNVSPLDFDGENDSLFHEYDKANNKFMEYLVDYGHFEDVPCDFIFDNLKESYPKLLEKYKGLAEFYIE